MCPLEGVSVLDFTRAVAGPFCTMILGDLGARVIKVEEPGGGDETRQWGPPFRGADSTYFLSVNRNKLSITLDLKSPAGLAEAKRLAASADVVMENFRPGVADRLGIGYTELRAVNRRIIYASISGFGQTGPDRLKPGYDLIVQAMSGLMQVSAEPNGPAVKTGFPVADIVAGLFTGQAVLAALYRRERTGEGARIEVSLLESLLAAMAPPVASYLLAGVDPAGMGGGQANIAPYQIFDSSDRPIAIGVPNDRIWGRFAQALGKPEWITDERFSGNASRNRHRPELVGEVQEVLRGDTAAAWIEKLERAEVPSTAVLSVGQALEEAQLKERGAIVEVEDQARGVLRMMANPIRIDGVKLRYTLPPLAGVGDSQGRPRASLGTPKAVPERPPAAGTQTEPSGGGL